MGNVCLFCNGKGHEFWTIEAMQKHMYDKGHCKIAYNMEKDCLEISSSYLDRVKQGKKAVRVLRTVLE